MRPIAKNKKAFFDFEILEKFEAGIVLTGSEVKAVRNARVNLKDSFCRFIKGELWLLNAHISHMDYTNPHFKPEPTRARKLLLHDKQLDKLYGKVSKQGLTVVALKIYFNRRNLCKVQIALAKGKKKHDKRETLKKKTMDMEAKQAVKDAL